MNTLQGEGDNVLVALADDDMSVSVKKLSVNEEELKYQ